MKHERNTFGTNHHDFVVSRNEMNELMEELNRIADTTEYPVQISVNGGITNFKEKRDLLHFTLGLSVAFDVCFYDVAFNL